jgi:hypothetical protein
MRSLCVLIFISGGGVMAQTKPDEKLPPELGRVPFLRDYAAAIAKAKADKKPLFVLFDEVPG